MNDLAFTAWAAGFFDGEGCICIAKGMKTGGRVITVTITNTERAPLEKFQAKWGGSICAPKISNLNHAQSYRWQIFSGKATAFLADIQPYVVSSKSIARIALALEFQSGKGTRGRPLAPGRLALEDEMRAKMQSLSGRRSLSASI